MARNSFPYMHKQLASAEPYCPPLAALYRFARAIVISFEIKIAERKHLLV